jgi:hypothetical protein
MKTLDPASIITISEDHILLHLNKTSLSGIIRSLSALPGFSLTKRRQSLLSDEAFATFSYCGFEFEITTPLSDYLIERPADCPTDIFNQILDQFRLPQPKK